MNIYIMRHGLTDWNLEKKIQGLTDIPLNETGIEQASEAFYKLKDIDYDVVYCSPLTRARQTASLVTGNRYPIIVDERIIERDFGDMEGIDIVIKDVEKIWAQPIDKPLRNEETFAHMLQRANSFINDLARVDNVLIVTHGAFFRALKVVLEDLDPNTTDLFAIKINNCELYKITKEF